MSNILAAAATAAHPATLPVTDQKIAFLMVTSICSGMTIITCGFVIITQGPSFKLTLDQNRQRFLALVSLLAAIFGLAGNGVELSDHPKSAGQSTASFFFNWFVQLGFAGIAHNSIIRLLTAQTRTPAPDLIKRTSLACCSFYFLTLPVMAPTFISLIHPSRADVKVVARDLNITFVCVIEALATVADLALLWRFTNFKANAHQTRIKMIRDMWIVYAFIWLSIGADIFAKVFRNETADLIPDLPITNLTLTLRAMAALMYGSTLRNCQEIYEVHSGTFGSSLSKSTLTFTAAKRPHTSQHTMIGSTERGSNFKMDTFTTETNSQRDRDWNPDPKVFDANTDL